MRLTLGEQSLELVNIGPECGIRLQGQHLALDAEVALAQETMKRRKGTPERGTRVRLVIVRPKQPGKRISRVRTPRDSQIHEQRERLPGIYHRGFVLDLYAWRSKHEEGNLCHRYKPPAFWRTSIRQRAGRRKQAHVTV